MEINFARAAANDVPAIIALMREFAEYEKLSDYLTITAENLCDALFAEDAFVNCLIAHADEMIIGYALFFPYFASFRGERGVYLEDIFIQPAYQGNRIGEKMLKEIAAAGKQNGACRMDFQVLEWNTPAVKFYLKHGAETNETERHFKFSGAAFAKLANK